MYEAREKISPLRALTLLAEVTLVLARLIVPLVGMAQKLCLRLQRESSVRRWSWTEGRGAHAVEERWWRALTLLPLSPRHDPSLIVCDARGAMGRLDTWKSDRDSQLERAKGLVAHQDHAPCAGRRGPFPSTSRGVSKCLAGPTMKAFLVCQLGILVPTLAAGGDVRSIVVSSAEADQDGILVHRIDSPYQRGRTRIRGVVPDKRIYGQVFPVIYVLPVEAIRLEALYGDGLLEVRRHGLHNRHQVIFVAPSFSDLPWYADHPSNAAISQETYFVKVVVPAVEANYPVSKSPKDRMLLGFSKSGWGAWTMLLRNPEAFGRACPSPKARPPGLGAIRDPRAPAAGRA